MRASELVYAAVGTTDKHQVLSEIRQNRYRNISIMQEVYDDDAMSRGFVFRWPRRFSQERDILEEAVRTGQPQTVRTERKIEEA